jgi:polar amino acid transport system substrate-binding protein
MTAVAGTPAIKSQIAPSGTLRCAINYNNPLLAKRDAATGKLSGISVDLSNELARRLGVPVELIPYDSAGSVSGAATQNVWDVAYLATDPKRAEEIDFSPAYLQIEGTYLAPAGSPLQNVEDVDRDGVRIAVTSNSAYDLFLSRELKHAKLVRAETTPKSIDMMLEQKLDAVAAVRTALVTASKDIPGSRVMKGHFMTIPHAIGVPKGRPEAARYISQFLEEMKASGAIAVGLERHGLGPNDVTVAPPVSETKHD